MGYTVTLAIMMVLCAVAANGASIDGETATPRLDKVKPEIGYHGLVKEGERTVDVTPRIRGVGAEICSFRITSKLHGEAPFELRMVDKERDKAEAELYAKKDLNCEKRKNYKFRIAAVGCDGRLSESAAVHVSVMDVNEYEPSFIEPAYNTQVDEGRLFDEIIQVKAKDEDCSPKYGDICKYEIVSSDQPFIIDPEGKIKNTEVLDWEKSHNHILNVVAYDCGMKRSKPISVSIKVNRVCRLGWKDVDERLEYTPGSGRRALFPTARLELCDVPCHVEHLSAKVTLATQHIGKGCDRDTYSVESQRKLCGASADSVDLLPTPGIGAEWTRNLPTDDGHESDQIYEFDGATNAVVIPPSTLAHDLTDNFTISTWMKHQQHVENNSHIREHVICNSDDHRMSRPHYALFVRNCRLIFLLRRDYTQENLNTFRPAEWRWKLPQVCDNEWHHYAVNVDFPDVLLFVDGQKFHVEKRNPEVIDDWPLHPTKGLNTTLVVGACWQGAENKMAHHFKGFLAGLSVLRGKTEKPSVLSCLHKCKESLEVPAMELLEPGMELQNNNDLTEVAIEGNNKTNLETLVRKVAYANSREFPTPGRRNLRLHTAVACSNGKILKVPAVESYVMVLQPEQPTITINGTPEIAHGYEDFKKGIKILQSISIIVSEDSEEEEDEDEDLRDDSGAGSQHRYGEHGSHHPSGSQHKLDSCTISVYPPLNPDHENFTLPEHQLLQLGITAKHNKDGVMISGADMIFNYELVLRQVHYMNRKPAYYLNRAFKLVCSELNGRFVSNEYVQTVTVIHQQVEGKMEVATKKAEDATQTRHAESPPEKEDAAAADAVSLLISGPAAAAAAPAHALVDQHHVEFAPVKITHAEDSSYSENSALDTSEAIAVSSASHAVTIIVVVCVGFLVFMIVLGVIRIRAAHQRAQSESREDDEMAWDDSSLTITVNPMGQIEEEAEEREKHPLREEEEDDSDSSDGGSSYHGESTDDEEAEKPPKERDLEWDDSLTF